MVAVTHPRSETLLIQTVGILSGRGHRSTRPDPAQIPASSVADPATSDPTPLMRPWPQPIASTVPVSVSRRNAALRTRSLPHRELATMRTASRRQTIPVSGSQENGHLHAGAAIQIATPAP